ncbi:hypothetical protein LEP1GSC052_0602 [Leptospira kmetyi serovar Malaysia str. Bejo-Iso9]|nr:hypothetical protein LEP1GSC052_0602 [Leptospira kmetyi serovar Malaysia str. Bejo-Iso9]
MRNKLPREISNSWIKNFFLIVPTNDRLRKKIDTNERKDPPFSILPQTG